MDRHDRIADLAAGYVLGALSLDEETEVREHLAACELAHPELEELGGVVPWLAETVELVEPPAGLRDRILAAAAADLGVHEGAFARDGARAGDVSRRDASSVIRPFPSESERVERARRRSPLGWAAAIAAVLAIAVLGGWNLTLQRDLDVARGYERGLSAVLDVAAQAGSQTAILAAEGGGGPTGLAAVTDDGRVAIVMRGLAPTSGSEVYEAWVIGAEGQPVPIGGFTVGPAGTASFTAAGTPAQGGVTLALTREPAPGATTPTLPIVSLGTATES